MRSGSNPQIQTVDETQPLLHEARESRGARFVRGFNNFVADAWSFAKKAAKILVQPMTLAVFVAAISPIYSSINAMMAPSGMSPALLGPAWLASMSTDVFAFSLFLLIASQGINWLANTRFNLRIFPRLKNSFSHMRTGPIKALVNIVFLLFALAAAVSIATISYNATAFMNGTWYLEAARYIIVGLTFGSIYASRFTGLDEFSDEAHRVFEVDGRQQLRVGFLLERQPGPVQRQINRQIATIVKSIVDERPDGDTRTALTSAEYKKYFNNLMARLHELHTNGDLKIVIAKTKKGWLIDIGYFGGNGLLFVGVGYVSYKVFTNKFNDGILILVRAISGQQMINAPQWTQILYSSPAGLASAFFYSMSTARIATTSVNLTHHVMHTLSHGATMFIKVGTAAAAFFVALFSGGSVASNVPVIRAIANSTDNLFGIQPDTTGWGVFDLSLLLLGTFATNFVSAAAVFFDNPDPKSITLRTTALRAKKMSDHLDEDSQEKMRELLELPDVSRISLFNHTSQGATSPRTGRLLLEDDSTDTSSPPLESVVIDGNERHGVNDSEHEDDTYVHDENKRMCVLM